VNSSELFAEFPVRGCGGAPFPLGKLVETKISMVQLS
jgi:hypothetical protein